MAVIFFRVYTLSALVVLAFMSPANMSFVPLVVLLLILIPWRYFPSAMAHVMPIYLAYYAIALLFVPVFRHPVGFALALPVLYLLDNALKIGAHSLNLKSSRHGRSLTPTGTSILVTSAVLLVLGIVLRSSGLILASTAALLYLGAIGLYALRNLPLMPVEAQVIQPRIIAGETEHLTMTLVSNAAAGGRLRLFSPYSWVTLVTQEITLTRGLLKIQATLAPLLSGPQTIVLQGHCLDRWGLIRVAFEIQPVAPIVIPRARYASWLAKKYLAGSNPGTLPVSTGMASVKALFGMRHGLEYFGNQSYQPGDSLKNIDWKRSLKYNELVSREYVESRAHPVVLLINLLADGAEQADKLAYNIVLSALNLAVEGIPASIAAYDEEKVVSLTRPLTSLKLVSAALDLLGRIRITPVSARYLNPPDLMSIRVNLARLHLIPAQPARVLEELLQIEYASLRETAVNNPGTKALTTALAKNGRQGVVMILSGRNHDAEALSYLTFNLAKDSRLTITAI